MYKKKFFTICTRQEGKGPMPVEGEDSSKSDHVMWKSGRKVLYYRLLE